VETRSISIKNGVNQYIRFSKAHMLLESDDDSGPINCIGSSDRDVDYAHEQNWNTTDEVVD
jgi:hypothetical protein